MPCLGWAGFAAASPASWNNVSYADKVICNANPALHLQDADRVASLLFTLRLMTGKGVMPTVAPNMDALLKLNARC